MHRWVELPEPDFGAAILNDCKYGYDALDAMVRITLVRGATHPYPDADRGEHRLRYGLFVHGGSGDLEQVHLAAERFNNPVAVIGDAGRPGTPGTARHSFAAVDSDCVTIETIKQAEDGKGLILRVFEHANRRVATTLRFGVPIGAVSVTNLMEEGAEPLVVEDNAVRLTLRPFEITTLRVTTA